MPDIARDFADTGAALMEWADRLERYGADPGTVADIRTALATLWPQVGMVIDALEVLESSLPLPQSGGRICRKNEDKRYGARLTA